MTELTEEETATWVARHLALAPERSELWGEQILATYLGETGPTGAVAA